jgi:hypothetical protein
METERTGRARYQISKQQLRVESRNGRSLLVCFHIVQAKSYDLDTPLLELVLDLAYLSCNPTGPNSISLQNKAITSRAVIGIYCTGPRLFNTAALSPQDRYNWVACMRI